MLDDDEQESDMAILRADLMMTGVLPDELNLKDEDVRLRLAESGFLAYRMHIALQPPSHLPRGVSPLRYIDQFLHFDVQKGLSVRGSWNVRDDYLHLPDSREEKSPERPSSRASTVRSAHPLFDDIDISPQGSGRSRSFSESSGPSIFSKSDYTHYTANSMPTSPQRSHSPSIAKMVGVR